MRVTRSWTSGCAVRVVGDLLCGTRLQNPERHSRLATRMKDKLNESLQQAGWPTWQAAAWACCARAAHWPPMPGADRAAVNRSDCALSVTKAPNLGPWQRSSPLGPLLGPGMEQVSLPGTAARPARCYSCKTLLRPAAVLPLRHSGHRRVGPAKGSCCMHLDMPLQASSRPEW